MKKTYEFQLPYFKQGDDLGHCLNREGVKTQAEGCLQHAEMMEHSAELLRRLAKEVVESGLQITQADVHFIHVEVEEEVGDRLVEEGLLQQDEWEEEEEEDDTAYPDLPVT